MSESTLQTVYQEILNINDNNLSFSNYYIIDNSGIKQTLDNLELDLDSFEDFIYSFKNNYGTDLIYNFSNDDVLVVYKNMDESKFIEDSEAFYLSCY